jgi:pimeloyl-ACP methyl ester carboxylesterase
MDISEKIVAFSNKYGKNVKIDNLTWRYYILGKGRPILWLTGGIRRAALGFEFMEQLAKNHTIIAPDYPPIQTIQQFNTAIDTIMHTENISTFTLAGQSYGGMLAQGYLAHKGEAVKRLILSNTGPVSAIGKIWFPILDMVIALVRILPENRVKKMLANQLLKHIDVPESERREWINIITDIMQKEFTRADALSHFVVAVDMLKSGLISPIAYRNWTGHVVILSAKNDPTQRKEDIPRYQQLFGRPVEIIDLGKMGHTASLNNPALYVEKLEQGLG